MIGCLSESRGWFRLALAIGIAIAFSSVAPCAKSQSIVPPIPLSPGYSDVAVDQTPALWPTPGYWIVSTQASPQSFDRSPPEFCPRVMRFDEGVGYRHANLAEVTQAIVPGLPVCIVVHGSFMDSASVYPESCSTWRWLKNACPDRPFQMIYFSWPSDQSLTALIGVDVLILGSRASRNGFYLANLIDHLPPECPLSLVGHSHGTRVISSALHLLGGGVVEGFRKSGFGSSGRRIRCVFAASAIDHDWLNPGQKFDRALCSTECLLNLRNCKDPALVIYPLRHIGSSRALGATGFTAKDRSRLMGWSGKVVDMDVSQDIGHRHLWPEYFGRPWLAHRISNYVFFPEMDSISR